MIGDSGKSRQIDQRKKGPIVYLTGIGGIELGHHQLEYVSNWNHISELSIFLG